MLQKTISSLQILRSSSKSLILRLHFRCLVAELWEQLLLIDMQMQLKAFYLGFMHFSKVWIILIFYCSIGCFEYDLNFRGCQDNCSSRWMGFYRPWNLVSYYLPPYRYAYHISIAITIISLLINFIHSRLRSIVISPSVRMALKLHQDHFVENFGEHPQSLYERISSYQSGIFISHEANISKMIKIQLLNL